jgi:hypothetical protein
MRRLSPENFEKEMAYLKEQTNKEIALGLLYDLTVEYSLYPFQFSAFFKEVESK